MAKASRPGGDLIDGYLAELDRRLAGAIVRNSPDRNAEIGDEAEDHLREAAAANVAAGMSELDAQRAAIATFGSAAAVARAHRPRPVAVLATVGTALLALLGSYALAAGVAGELIALFLPSNPGESGSEAVGAAPVVAPRPAETTLYRLTDGSNDPARYAASFGVVFLIGIALFATYFIIRRSRRANGRAARMVPVPGPFYPAATAGVVLLMFSYIYTPYGSPLLALAEAAYSLSGSVDLLYGVINGLYLVLLAYGLWSVVVLGRWIVTRVNASRQRLVVSA